LLFALGVPKLMLKFRNTLMDQFANTVIDRLGGTTAVARIFGIEPPSVSEWRRHGIPDSRLLYLRLAKPIAFIGLDEYTALPERLKP